MAVYEVLSLDAWGNPLTGYEINDSVRQGVLMLPASFDSKPGFREAILERLAKAEFLDPNAVQDLTDEILSIEVDFESITISEIDTGFVAVDVNEEPGEGYPQSSRYLSARNQRTAEDMIDPETERVEEVEGYRPILELSLLDGRTGTSPFYRQKLDGTVVELRINPFDDTAGKRRSGAPDYKIDIYVDTEFSGTFMLDELKDQVIGVTKNGKDIEGSAELISNAKVALDDFLERGGESGGPFVQTKESLLDDEAKKVLDDLRANLKAWDEKRITFEQFGDRNRELWSRARELGVDNELAQLMSVSAQQRPGVPDSVKKLRVGDNVKFATPAHHNIANFDIDISGMTGRVTQKDSSDLWIELDSLEYADELSEWDNALHFELTAGHYPKLESVQNELTQRGLPYKPCGLNADWNTQAWMLSPGVANRENGAYYLLDTEDDNGNYLIVRRTYEGDPGYDERSDGIEEVIEDGPLSEVLDAYIGLRNEF